MKMLKITLQGKTYEVGVELLDSTPAAVPAPAQVTAPAAYIAPPAAAPVAAPTPPPPAAGGHMLSSPMTGIVFKIRVSVGQQVAKDQELLVLEAMKMESPVYAPHAGTIASIHVKESDAVSEGQALIQLS